MRSIALVLAPLLLSGCSGIAEQLYAPVDPDNHEPVRFTVEKGTTARSLGGSLAEAGLVRNEQRWLFYLKLSGDGACLKAGDFELRPSQSLPELMETMCGVPIPDDVPFTVVEGWRIRDIDAAMVEAGLIEAGAYQALAEDPSRFTLPFTVEGPTLEGYLFPDTYKISADEFDPEKFIQRQLTAFYDRFGHGAVAGFGNHTLHEVVIMASMLEREEPKPENRPMVAGVLWKRLDGSWNLGVDATSRYTLEDWNDRRAFLKKLRDPDDPYNTRLRGGLPPTAIGNAGLDSLRAAITPEDSRYWYYLHDERGDVHFARDGREHEANRRHYNVY